MVSWLIVDLFNPTPNTFGGLGFKILTNFLYLVHLFRIAVLPSPSSLKHIVVTLPLKDSKGGGNLGKRGGQRSGVSVHIALPLVLRLSSAYFHFKLWQSECRILNLFLACGWRHVLVSDLPV